MKKLREWEEKGGTAPPAPPRETAFHGDDGDGDGDDDGDGHGHGHGGRGGRGGGAEGGGEEGDDESRVLGVYICSRDGCTFGTTTTNKKGSRRCPCGGYNPGDRRPRKHSQWVLLGDRDERGEGIMGGNGSGGGKGRSSPGKSQSNLKLSTGIKLADSTVAVDEWNEDNNAHCSSCSHGSSIEHPLFCCEGCPTSYHAACLPTEDFDRVDLWTCPDCRVAFNVIEKGSAEGELKGVKLRQRRAFLRVHGWGLEISSASGHYRYTSPDKSFHTGKVPRVISNHIMFSVIE